MTWDGLVTKYFKKHIEKLEINEKVVSYIQTQVIKRTMESVLMDCRAQDKDEDVLDHIMNEMEREEDVVNNLYQK